MVANVEAMVRAGIEAYRAGKKAEARKLLEKAIELDDYNEQAWMWLSAVVETDEEKQTCLENVLVINPDNEEAKRGLKMIGVDGGGTSEPAPVATDEVPASSPFTDTGMQDFGDADFTSDSDDDFAAPPTATSSASSVYQGPETSAHEYDAWVDNLNLGGGNEEIVEEPEPEPDDEFGSVDMTDMFGLDDSDDIFGTDDPFGSEPAFDDDIASSSTFTSGPFGGDSDDDDVFGIDDDLSPAPASRSATAPVTSPGAENLDDDSLFSDLDNAEFSGGDFFTGDEDFDDVAQPDFTPDELFSFIPDDIRPTRLPGTKKGVSAGSLLVLMVLVVMNLVAVMFIVTSIS